MGAHRNLVTYFPPATQKLLARNRAAMAGRPYERFFDDELWIHDEGLAAVAAPIDPATALDPGRAGLNSLLDAGHHQVETGYCEMPDGSGYVASRVPFPGCSGEMLAWWMWWHAVEPARYTLWYPTNHVAAHPVDRSVLSAPGLTHEQRYIGSTHHVDEYVGSDLVKLAISFVDPAELGLDTARFADAGIVAHACARVSLRAPGRRAPGGWALGLEVVTMVHLARRTEDGFELRSRYWIGHDPRISARGRSLPVDGVARPLGLIRLAGAGRTAYEQLLHDQIEFTHLSTFLADIHHEFA